MFRNQYDTDVTTWSPQGRLFQVEYAMEAVKQGSAAIGLRSKSHVVLASVNKAQSELSSHQKKIFKVDEHIGVAIAGLTADGRVLSRYMRSECINYTYTYDSPLPVGRLVVQLADKAQDSIRFAIRYNTILIHDSNSDLTTMFLVFTFSSHHHLPSPPPPTTDHLTSFGEYPVDGKRYCDLRPPFGYLVSSDDIGPLTPTDTFGYPPLPVCTQRSWKRPYGVGLLVAGLDESGAHLYYNCPSGNYFEYQAFAIGSRSQAAKTYLERRFESFMSSSREDLLKDALFALRETLQGEKLKSSICTVSVVGVGEAFHMLDNETVQSLIDAFEIVGEEVPPATEEGDASKPAADQGALAPADEGAAPMDI
ncbi:hypothetical protein TEA_017307 [Camellia sinensis var. sinensis]|uniref:Proteasome alpha-type subunits domain-containing protein n=1 Tax=Camellia sinensis var. sinensis TaxID=542762 RepID=A0A4V3WNV9_CAMSN|nr:hypothetical protein TEA_017307 [Camellia sinensis var. sinensis]